MRVLIDQPFLDVDGEVTPSGVALWRHNAAPIDDEGLLDAAERGGFDAVCYLGEGHLASGVLSDRAVRAGIVVAVTNTSNPVKATALVRRYAHRLARFPPGTVVRLLADGPHRHPAAG